MIRHWLSRLVCFLTGHIYVNPSAMWKMLKIHQYSELDGFCLRCSRVVKVGQAISDSVFAPSPLLQKLRDKYGDEIDEEESSL